MINLQFDFKQANEEEKALLLKSVDNPSEIERFATTYEKGILFGKTRVIFAGRVYKDNYRLLGFVNVNKNSEEFDFEREFWLSLVNSKTRIPLEEKKSGVSKSVGYFFKNGNQEDKDKLEKWFTWFKDEKIKTEFVDNGYQYSYEDDYMIETIPLPNGEVFCAVTRRTIAEEKKPVPISDSSGHCKPEDGYEYYVIRKAKGDRFEESSFAKVVSADELIFINESQAVYKDELVFIQNLGDKEKCEKIKNGCNYELRHFGIGKEW